jgi:serine/threonine protein kinase
MELCDGETLDARLKRRGMDWREAASSRSRLPRARGRARGGPRAPRPQAANLMLTDANRAPSSCSTSAWPWRSPTWTAPHEKKRAEGLRDLRDARVHGARAGRGRAGRRARDVYALGCVLYEMLTGERAFEGPSSVVVMGKQLRETPEPPRVRAPARKIPAALEAIVVRAMAKGHPPARDADRRGDALAEHRQRGRRRLLLAPALPRVVERAGRAPAVAHRRLALRRQPQRHQRRHAGARRPPVRRGRPASAGAVLANGGSSASSRAGPSSRSIGLAACRGSSAR